MFPERTRYFPVSLQRESELGRPSTIGVGHLTRVFRGQLPPCRSASLRALVGRVLAVSLGRAAKAWIRLETRTAAGSESSVLGGPLSHRPSFKFMAQHKYTDFTACDFTQQGG